MLCFMNSYTKLSDTAMESLQQVAEAWTKIPKQFSEEMKWWNQQRGKMNIRIWLD